MSEPTVAVLFARADSIYKSFSECDVWDAGRDARNFSGGLPVIAHPPCRAWGRLRGLATIIPEEKALAFFAVDQVRRCGGVLEHPWTSSLWPAAGLPKPGSIDQWGGWTLPVHQFWWGHRAEKRTWLYIVGVSPANIPPIPLVLGEAPCTISTTKRKYRTKPETSKHEREATPPRFAAYLVDLALRCRLDHEVVA